MGQNALKSIASGVCVCVCVCLCEENCTKLRLPIDGNADEHKAGQVQAKYPGERHDATH